MTRTYTQLVAAAIGATFFGACIGNLWGHSWFGAGAGLSVYCGWVAIVQGVRL